MNANAPIRPPRPAVRSNPCANGHIGPIVPDGSGNMKCRACNMTVMGG